jgi:hypothetical protein
LGGELVESPAQLAHVSEIAAIPSGVLFLFPSIAAADIVVYDWHVWSGIHFATVHSNLFLFLLADNNALFAFADGQWQIEAVQDTGQLVLANGKGVRQRVVVVVDQS